MEQVKGILSHLRPATNIPGLKMLEPTDTELLDELRRNIGVTSLDHTFANFKKHLGTSASFQAFFDFATQPHPKPLLLCYGGVGNGKTHLLEATSIELYRRGLFSRVLSYSHILALMKASMSDQTALPSYDGLLKSMCETPILLLDDVGSGSSDSKWAYAILEDIVVARAERLRTAITTNRDPKELPERVVSRFRDGAYSVMVLNEGADYRRERK